MDYNEKKELIAAVKAATEKSERALSLVEAVTRKHAEQDGKLQQLLDRIARLERILKVDIQASENVPAGAETPKESGWLGRVLGR